MDYINDVTVSIDGKSYKGNKIWVMNPSRFGLYLYGEADKLEMDRSSLAYKALLSGENGRLIYECSACKTNGHIMNFKIDFPSKNIHIIRTLKD